MSDAFAWRLVRGLLLGLAGFALLAHALLLGGASVPAVALPICAAAGIAGGHCGRRPAVPTTVLGPRWLLPTTLASVALVTVVLGYGALATADRDWDGIVAWGLKANALAARPSLDQPLFADPAVFHHSPDYPLLQPLCIAALGRIVLPLQYVMLVALVGLATLRRSGDRALACSAALGIGLTPDLIATGGGGVDSGYAEALHALVLATVAAALLLDDVVLLAAAAVLLPFAKPEGTVHVVALVVAVVAFAPLRSCVGAVVAAAVGLLVWLPLQLHLAHAPPASGWLPAGVVGGASAVLAVRWMGRGCRLGARTAWLLGTVAVAAAILVLVTTQPLFSGSRTVLLSHYLGDLDRAVRKLPATPTIAVGLLGMALAPRRFGALFVLALLLLPGALRRRSTAAVGAGAGLAVAPDAAGGSAAASPTPARGEPALPASLIAFLLLALLAIVAAFYLSPEPDVRHHLRSSAGRLLLQLAGATWIAVAAELSPRLAVASLPRWLAQAFGRPAG